MPIYWSENVPSGDGLTAGGTIDFFTLTSINSLSDTGSIYIWSSSPNDTGIFNIYGIDSGISNTSGISGYIFDSGYLSGLDKVTVSGVWRSVHRFLYSGVHEGTLTVFDDSGIIVEIPSGISGCNSAFVGLKRDTSPVDREYHQKLCVYNDSPTTKFGVTAQVTEYSSSIPGDIIDIGWENDINNANTTSDRLIAPTGVSGYGQGPSGFPRNSGALGSGDFAGLWIKTKIVGGEVSGALLSYQITISYTGSGYQVV